MVAGEWAMAIGTPATVLGSVGMSVALLTLARDLENSPSS